VSERVLAEMSKSLAIFQVLDFWRFLEDPEKPTHDAKIIIDARPDGLLAAAPLVLRFASEPNNSRRRIGRDEH
jgi:hypothetical protein